jgi:hypothetical protein
LFILVALVTDPRSIQGQVQRAFWVTLTVGILYYIFEPLLGIYNTPVTTGLLFLVLLSDFWVYTVIQFLERLTEPSVALLIERLGILKPIQDVLWAFGALLVWFFGALNAIREAVATGKPVMLPGKPNLARPTVEEVERYADYLVLEKAIAEHYRQNMVGAKKIVAQDAYPSLLQFLLAWSLAEVMYAWSSVRAYASAVLSGIWGVPRRLEAVSQGIVRFFDELGSNLFKATYETGITFGFYALWWLHHGHHGGRTQFLLSLGAVIAQVGYYTATQFVGRFFEPYVLALFGVPLSKTKVYIGKLVGKLSEALGFLSGYVTEKLTEEIPAEDERKPMLLLAPASEPDKVEQQPDVIDSAE